MILLNPNDTCHSLLTLFSLLWTPVNCHNESWLRLFNVCEPNTRSYVVRCGKRESGAQRAVQQTTNIHLYARMPLAFSLLTFYVLLFLLFVHMYIIHTLSYRS